MIETSKKIRNYFEQAKESIDLPGFSRFPEGACEGASLFLGIMLHELFPTANINYIKGYKTCGEMHFWLKVDGATYDITADQFEGISSPIYDSNTQSLESVFNDLETQPIELAFLESDVTTTIYKDSLTSVLRYVLTNNV